MAARGSMVYLNLSSAKIDKEFLRRTIVKISQSRCSQLASGGLIGSKTHHFQGMHIASLTCLIPDVPQRELQTSCLSKRDYSKVRLYTQ